MSCLNSLFIIIHEYFGEYTVVYGKCGFLYNKTDKNKIYYYIHEHDKYVGILIFMSI